MSLVYVLVTYLEIIRIVIIMVITICSFFSVWAWELADTLLIQNKGKENNHFAATMLRNKIQKEFRELPENSHLSLRDSLLKHLELYREGHFNCCFTALVFIFII